MHPDFTGLQRISAEFLKIIEHCYNTWYNDFSDVITVSDTLLATHPLGGNIPVRSGNIVKVPSSPTVYAVEPGAVLRPLDNEEVAEQFYGNAWMKKVIDIPEVFFSKIGIRSCQRFS